MKKAKQVKVLNTPNLDNEISLKLIASAIKARRTQLGLDIHTASMLCGVSVVTLSKIEKASNGVRFESVLKVLKALGIECKIMNWGRF